MGRSSIRLIAVLFFLAAFCSCTVNRTIRGDWGVLDPNGSYSELCFSDSAIEIYDELAGSIASQTYSIKDDSLVTNILGYRMKWINPDSLHLVSGSFILRLKRIKTGFKLSEYTSEKLEDTYIHSFYNRMHELKGTGLNPAAKTNSNQKPEEETPEIRKPD